jgi:putative flippase GtrA
VTERMRWVRFNVVGVMGFALQTVTLSLLVERAGLSTGLAVTTAVLVAVSHNFLWHEHITWPNLPREHRWKRWVSFHVSTGALSVVGNVIMTGLVMAATGLSAVAANLVAVIAMSLANFWVSDRVVFREGAEGAEIAEIAETVSPQR